jgi:hypothetical protein
MLQYLTLLEVRRELQARVSRDLAIFEKRGVEFLRMSNRSNRSRSAALIPICSIFLIGADLQVRANL